MKKALAGVLVLAVAVIIWIQLGALKTETGGRASPTKTLDVTAPARAVINRGAEGMMQDIHDQVAADAVAQYDIAKRGEDPIQTCVQAGLVSAAFLQAKDEAGYNKWKAIEKADCSAAGIPK